ncbi:MAG: hypothetical protein Q7U35_04200 [Methanobacteriaceae archaeon]|nr:hypothetical protein [Methanobacteriaceae archaeon]MDP2835690.1 hypothetical protein [Methanobacteriaceae archaeon]MDP3035159.1 hypothetical protein [Methanobacteriaceae archaeon]MDP3622907.1 hypothetical protein [Methanobacteriaceae archaeon]
MKNHCYENYPLKIVFLSNILILSIYIIDAAIIYNLGWFYSVLYLIYCLILEIKVLKTGCVNCYYYGKICGFGKGRLSALFFKKGDPSKFSHKELKWKDMIPDMLVFIVPTLAGIFILLSNFSWLILSLIAVLLILSLFGNALIRGLTCPKCKQSELGCPAQDLFQKNEK